MFQIVFKEWRNILNRRKKEGEKVAFYDPKTYF